MELALGRLRDAEHTLENALDLAERHGPDLPAVMRGTADMLVGLSRAAWHRNELASAAEFLRRADALGESAGLPQYPYRWRVALARLRTASGDFTEALELLDEAERVYVGDYSPPVHPIHATRARALAASGDVAAALAWARKHAVGVDDDLTYLREYEHVTLARVLLADHQASRSAASLGKATALLDRLLAASEAGGRAGTVIEVEVLRTLAHRAAEDRDTALVALEHAVDLAEPDGWIRVFVDAGPSMTEALRDLAAQRPGRGFVQVLLAAATSAERTTADDDARADTAPVARGASEQRLRDPLSDRELDVLRLLGSELDGPGIARELVVSLNTVRTHTKHIYTKLDVNNRRSAVARAHQLGLLSRTIGH
jgi:ATP/maltotriose-dependent transcriptional regulator MalT